MAGVAGPMLARSRAQGTRFLTGLLAGELISAAVVSTVVYLLGTLAGLVMPRTAREILTAIVILALGVADLMNRTPHIWRQVPQRFVRTLSPGRLGLVWGFDLALLVTTQKSTSLTWASLAAVGLLFPADSWLILLTMTAVGVLTVVARSVVYSIRGPALGGDRDRPWFRVMRRTGGVALVAIAAATVAGVW